MIGIMNIIALIIGIAVGVGFFHGKEITWLFITLYMAAFNSKEKFYDLYDVTDDELSFAWYVDHNADVSNYADYLKLHSEARPSAYKTFNRMYKSLKRMLLWNIPIILAPAILFWSNWYFYLAGVAMAFIGFVAYDFAKNSFELNYYQRVVIFSMLSIYHKNKVKSDQE